MIRYAIAIALVTAALAPTAFAAGGAPAYLDGLGVPPARPTSTLLSGRTLTTYCGLTPFAQAGAEVLLYARQPAIPLFGGVPEGAFASAFSGYDASGHGGSYAITVPQGSKVPPNPVWALIWRPGEWGQVRIGQIVRVSVPAHLDLVVDITPLDDCRF